MPGLKIFSSLEEAVAAGFAVYERIPDGFLVRRTMGTKLALAIVKTKTPQPKDESPGEPDEPKSQSNPASYN